MRRFRKAKSTENLMRSGDRYHAIVELPLRVQRMWANNAEDVESDCIKCQDESDWPGGMEQRFRSLRPLVDLLLEGYDAEFVGMLEAAADGVGER